MLYYGINTVLEEHFARENFCFPMRYEKDDLVLGYVEGVSDLTRMQRELSMRSILNVRYQAMPLHVIERLINTYYTIELKEQQLYREIRTLIHQEQFEQLFLFVVQKAEELGASDIHIAQEQDECIIRFRLKGMLKTFAIVESSLASIIGRIIKVKGNADISRSLKPVDARICLEVNRQALDMRVSIVNTIEGEKISIRLLKNENVPTSLSELGISQTEIRVLEHVLRKESGAILITGPTGSGKSTTVRCFLNQINDATRHIISIEDPIEYRMQGVTQIQVDEREESNFSQGVRSVLRQDPDILFIGEIRDEISAEVAMKASITGHLVFSTLHTRTPGMAIERLENLGIDRHLIFSAISMIINQRLIAQSCPHCRQKRIYQGEPIDALGLKKGDCISDSSGCEHCGYSGVERLVPIMSMVMLDREKREEYQKSGVLPEDDTIREHVITKFKRGEISLAEARRFL